MAISLIKSAPRTASSLLSLPDGLRTGPSGVEPGRNADTGSVPDAPVPFNPPATLLVVEDNEFSQRVVEGITKPLNLNLLKAANGLEALACLRKQAVDLVLLDIQMPLLDGYATARHIRATLRLTTPIVALTGDTHQRADYQARGLNAYLTKPFTRQQLLRVIQQQMRSATPFPLPAQPAPPRLNRAVLADLYADDWAFVRQQVDAFQQEWLRQCGQLSESLDRQQITRFRQQVHTFSTTLYSLGMMAAATHLKQLSQQCEQLMPAERSGRWRGLVDEIEEALTELYQLSRSAT